MTLSPGCSGLHTTNPMRGRRPAVGLEVKMNFEMMAFLGLLAQMLGYTDAEAVNTITPADLHDPQELIARAAALSLEFGCHRRNHVRSSHEFEWAC